MSDIEISAAERDDYIRNHFRGQAKACDVLGSPFTASVCRAIADGLARETDVGRAVLDWPGTPRDDALSLRVCGALHGLVLSGVDAELAAAYPPNEASEDALRELLPSVFRRHANCILAGLESAPQTNEVARSGMLMPGFLSIARQTGLPLALFEIGSSAGLNQLFDRFHYRYGDVQWGDGASAVRLAPDVRGAPPPLNGDLKIVSRQGCDIAPVDVSNAEARLKLRSYVWPDQALRLQRIDEAIELAATTGFTLQKIGAAAFARQTLQGPQPGLARVLFHSIMWQYMPESERNEIDAAMGFIGTAATKDAPLAWLRMEPLDTRQPHATLMLTLWPGGETKHIAKCDYHGRWIEWTDR